jgi:hypothetical protein
MVEGVDPVHTLEHCEFLFGGSHELFGFLFDLAHPVRHSPKHLPARGT